MKNGRKPFDPKAVEEFKRAAAMGPVEFARVSIPMDASAEADELDAIVRSLRWRGAFGPDNNIIDRAADAIERLRAELSRS